MNTATSGKRNLFLIPRLCGLPSLLKIVVKRDYNYDSPVTSFSLQSPFIPQTLALSGKELSSKQTFFFFFFPFLFVFVVIVEMLVSLPFPTFAF